MGRPEVVSLASRMLTGRTWPHAWCVSLSFPDIWVDSDSTDLRHNGEATVRCSCGETFTVDARALRELVESGKKMLAEDEAGELGESR